MTNKQLAINEDQKLKEYLESEGYFNVRILPDGVIGNLDMIFTRAVMVELDWGGVRTRYCYEDRELAVQACNSLESIEQKPLDGYTAVKGDRREWQDDNG